MKTLKLFGLTLFVILSCVCFCACSSDDDSSNEGGIREKDIYGVWAEDPYFKTDENHVYEFKKGGEFVFRMYYNKEMDYSEKGKWTFKNNTITFIVTEGEDSGESWNIPLLSVSSEKMESPFFIDEEPTTLYKCVLP